MTKTLTRKQQKFRKLEVWKKAMDAIEKVYQLTDSFPGKELYGLASQIRRASTSIALNIAEGSGCSSDAEFKRFLNIALRSNYELICGLEIANRLQYINEMEKEEIFDQLEEISAMLSGFISKLKTES